MLRLPKRYAGDVAAVEGDVTVVEMGEQATQHRSAAQLMLARCRHLLRGCVVRVLVSVRRFEVC